MTTKMTTKRPKTTTKNPPSTPRDGMSRRTFMKAAGATATFAIASGYSPFSYANNEKVRVASIGTGGQGSFHLRYGLSKAKNIEIVALCDVYKAHLYGWLNEKDKAGNLVNDPDRRIKTYLNYREMLDKEDIDACVIATPLHTHHDIAVDCLDAGKHVFCQKTLCYTIEDCRDLVKKVHDTGLVFQVGHQRHYNPWYNKAMWLAHDPTQGKLGRINHISMQWHRNNSWRRPVLQKYEDLSPEEKQYIPDIERHINWRLYQEYSGGLVTELATHQLDVANWFLGAYPTKVSGYGGIDYWRDGREVADNIVLIYEYKIGYDALSYTPIAPRIPEQKVAELNQPYTVRVMYSSLTASGKKGANELIQGDRGSIEISEAGGCRLFGDPVIPFEEIQKKKQQQQATGQTAADAVTSGKSLNLPTEAYTEGVPVEVYVDQKGESEDLFEDFTDVDRIQFDSFANDIMTGGTPKANVMVGFQTAIAGLAGLQAIREGVEVEIKPEWYAFDFQTPDPYRYDYWAGFPE